LLKACEVADQAKTAQWHSVVDVDFPQRILIQRMANALLLLCQGVPLPRCVHGFQNSLGETKSLFEASHKGSIRGVPFAFLFSRS
jgi:hypothetical protein